MVSGAVKRKEGVDGCSQPPAEIDGTLSKRRRISATGRRVGFWTKAMLASFIGVAVVAALFKGGECLLLPYDHTTMVALVQLWCAFQLPCNPNLLNAQEVHSIYWLYAHRVFTAAYGAYWYLENVGL